MGYPRIRTLPLLLIAALIAGCSSGTANPPLTTQSEAQRTTESSNVLDSASKMKIRLVAPLDASMSPTGVVLQLNDPRCAHKPIPQKLDDDGFPLDANAFGVPHSAKLQFTVVPFTNPCTGHSDGVHSMSFVFPSPVPSATPVFGANGYYAIALQADSQGRITMFDVSGPVSVGDDGTMRFTQNWLPLSAGDTYAFYLATLENHSDEDDD